MDHESVVTDTENSFVVFSNGRRHNTSHQSQACASRWQRSFQTLPAVRKQIVVSLEVWLSCGVFRPLHLYQPVSCDVLSVRLNVIWR